jgi:hypothetical protein
MECLGPVLHLARADDNGIFDAYAFVLRTMWAEHTTSLHRQHDAVIEV